MAPLPNRRVWKPSQLGTSTRMNVSPPIVCSLIRPARRVCPNRSTIPHASKRSCSMFSLVYWLKLLRIPKLGDELTGLKHLISVVLALLVLRVFPRLVLTDVSILGCPYRFSHRLGLPAAVVSAVLYQIDVHV